MDAASNRGIDDIKEIIEHTKYKPGMARYKIFIIDEVHMLTPQAFNALLKTLEEPPAFVKFILATTDPLKLPATILSRSQHFRFKKISHKLVLQHLEHILNKEGIEYEHSALEVIARSGAGSLRDSLTLLDQAIVYSKNFVDSVTVTRMLGIIEVSLLENLVKNILARNESEILAFVKDSAEYETEMIINELILHLKERLLSQDPLIQPMILDRFFRILSDAKSLLALNADGEFILLLTLLKMVEALQIKEIDSMIKTLEKELNGSLPASPTMISSPNISKTNQTIVLSMEEIGIEAAPQHKHEVKSSTQNETQTKHIEITNQNEPNSQPDPLYHHKQKQTFDLLIKKIYDRDYELGECFEKNIHFCKI
jgi:DNA polymerase-3 subunit gamma/tau